MQNRFFLFTAALIALMGFKVLQPGGTFGEPAFPSEFPEYAWIENDSTFALVKDDKVIWQYNFNTKFNKPFFHPIRVNNNTITGLSPDDHIWHLGQWFSWKYINQTNYWEYMRGAYASEGVTSIRSIQTKKGSDHSAVIVLNIEYHPQKGMAVLEERREVRIAPPQPDGSIRMDYLHTFSPLVDDITIDRTPLEGEPGGRSWGGYGGLSIRFNLDFSDAAVISDAAAGVDGFHGTTGNWLYMGFSVTDGKRVGSMIMIGNETKGEGEAWYVTSNPNIPFYFINPAYVFLKPRTLRKGETMNMNYRVVHLEGAVSKEELADKYKQYLNL